MSRSARPTTSSECPSPYTAAVSIQLTPDSTAWRIAAIDSASSWSPQAWAQSPPPMAQAPNPTRVSSMSVQPSLTVGNDVVIVVLLYRWSRESADGRGGLSRAEANPRNGEGKSPDRSLFHNYVRAAFPSSLLAAIHDPG